MAITAIATTTTAIVMFLFLSALLSNRAIDLSLSEMLPCFGVPWLLTSTAVGGAPPCDKLGHCKIQIGTMASALGHHRPVDPVDRAGAGENQAEVLRLSQNDPFGVMQASGGRWRAVVHAFCSGVLRCYRKASRSFWLWRSPRAQAGADRSVDVCGSSEQQRLL